MWHHSFDPHLHVEAIPEAELKHIVSKFFSQRSESVHDFLNKSNIKQGLIRSALEKTAFPSLPN